MAKKTEAPPAEVVDSAVKEEVVVPAPKLSPTKQFALARREELLKEKEQILVERKPFRDYLDNIAADSKFVEAGRQIKASNARLGPIDNELAQLAKVLGTTAFSQGPAVQADAKAAAEGK